MAATINIHTDHHEPEASVKLYADGDNAKSPWVALKVRTDDGTSVAVFISDVEFLDKLVGRVAFAAVQLREAKEKVEVDV